MNKLKNSLLKVSRVVSVHMFPDFQADIIWVAK